MGSADARRIVLCLNRVGKQTSHKKASRRTSNKYRKTHFRSQKEKQGKGPKLARWNATKVDAQISSLNVTPHRQRSGGSLGKEKGTAGERTGRDKTLKRGEAGGGGPAKGVQKKRTKRKVGMANREVGRGARGWRRLRGKAEEN